MSALQIQPNDIDRLAGIAARMQSDHDGEVLTAARMTVRTLDKFGLRIGDVLRLALQPQPASVRPKPVSPSSHYRDCMECLACPDALNGWEASFVADLAGQSRLSLKQAAKLGAILAKVRKAGGRA